MAISWKSTEVLNYSTYLDRNGKIVFYFLFIFDKNKEKKLTMRRQRNGQWISLRQHSKRA